MSPAQLFAAVVVHPGSLVLLGILAHLSMVSAPVFADAIPHYKIVARMDAVQRVLDARATIELPAHAVQDGTLRLDLSTGAGQPMQVQTYPIDVGGTKKTIRVRVEFVQPGDDIRLLQLKPTEVVVEVAAKTVEKTFRGVAVQKGKEEEFSPSSATVVVQGGYSRVKEMQAEEIEITVDWNAAGDDAATRPLKVVLPQGLTLLSVQPESVKVK